MLIIAESKAEDKIVHEIAKRFNGRAVKRDDAFAITFWSFEDYIAQNLSATKSTAQKYMQENEKQFKDAITEYGNELLVD